MLWHWHSGIEAGSIAEDSLVSFSVHSIWCFWSIVFIFWNRNVRYLNRTCCDMSKTSTARRLSKQSSPLLNEWRGHSTLSSELIRHSFGLKIYSRTVGMNGWFPNLRLTLHIYLIIDALVWSKLLWKSHGQFWHPSQWLRIVKIPSGQRLLQLASMWLILSGWNLYEHLDHICKKTGAEAYCSMKCHRIHHQYFFVCVETVLYSDNNSDTELNV